MMESEIKSQRSITVNLTRSLDDYVRRSARQCNKSMNQIINEAVEYYRKRGKANG